MTQVMRQKHFKDEDDHRGDDATLDNEIHFPESN